MQQAIQWTLGPKALSTQWAMCSKFRFLGLSSQCLLCRKRFCLCVFFALWRTRFCLCVFIDWCCFYYFV